jgi:hypothetical protein
MIRQPWLKATIIVAISHTDRDFDPATLFNLCNVSMVRRKKQLLAMSRCLLNSPVFALIRGLIFALFEAPSLFSWRQNNSNYGQA